MNMNVSAWEDDDEGIDDDDEGDSGTKEILGAAEHGHLDIVKTLIAVDPLLVHARDKDLYTPLHRAAYNNHPEVVKYLLVEGARHDAKTIDDWQPLHSACRWNNATCAAILIDHGADVNAVSTGLQTPLHLAASNSYAKETMILLLMNDNINPHMKNVAGETPKEIATRTGRFYELFDIVEPCIRSHES